MPLQPSPRREEILRALSEHEPFLTTRQLALLFYSVGKDGKLKTAPRVKARKTSHKVYTLAPGYFTCLQMLHRMKASKLISQHELSRQDPGKPDLWSMKGRRVPRNYYNAQHEEDCANVYCALRRTGRLVHWDSRWTDEEYSEFARATGINYDRRFELEGVDQILFLEVDRGTEDLKTLFEKVRKYKRMSDTVSGDRFSVLFTFQSSHHFNADRRIDRFVDELHKQRIVAQFLVAVHDHVVTDPLGKVINPVAHPDRLISLADLT